MREVLCSTPVLVREVVGEVAKKDPSRTTMKGWMRGFSLAGTDVWDLPASGAALYSCWSTVGSTGAHCFPYLASSLAVFLWHFVLLLVFFFFFNFFSPVLLLSKSALHSGEPKALIFHRILVQRLNEIFALWLFTGSGPLAVTLFLLSAFHALPSASCETHHYLQYEATGSFVAQLWWSLITIFPKQANVYLIKPGFSDTCFFQN